MRELFEKGAEVDAKGEGPRSADGGAGCRAKAAHAAAKKGMEEMVRELAGKGQRPLHAAAKKGMEEMVRELVEKSAEVDAEDGEGRTALTVALAFGQEGAARALLEAGAGVNAGTGRRPLHAAAERGMVEMMRELAAKGAEVDAEDVWLVSGAGLVCEAWVWPSMRRGWGVERGPGYVVVVWCMAGSLCGRGWSVARVCGRRERGPVQWAGGAGKAYGTAGVDRVTSMYYG
ncbi:hypothetical protein CYMTET_23476 [Cymbomonas tetramitiformis]|uniref:Uncharacterized protein n=1 Tax=Cymbomonas tetramitiformis TaxID=36881 RepID=A0AAE0FZ95_9CHLO|nr:hypothetical protein CYMTET_23476 [Cymbomonas tetramitiformis]